MRVACNQNCAGSIEFWVTLVELFAGNKAVARQFLNAPNRSLERRAPIEFIETGDLAPLELYVDAMNARQLI